MSVLPVNRTTLIYGTSDGGVHVHNKNEVFSQKMQKMNTRLNLKAHTCGAQKRKTKVFFFFLSSLSFPYFSNTTAT